MDDHEVITNRTNKEEVGKKIKGGLGRSQIFGGESKEK
jgi:hypothetical protein